jgi:hypothetical protein
MGKSYPVWQGDDEDVVDRFDETFSEVGSWSRSAAIKEQLELAIVIEDTLDALDVDVDGRDRRAAVRQALLDYFDGE